jgi:hypothetical protein
MSLPWRAPILAFRTGTEDGDASVETVTPADSLPTVSDDDGKTGLECGYARGKENGGVNELDVDDDGDVDEDDHETVAQRLLWSDIPPSSLQSLPPSRLSSSLLSRSRSST